MAMATRKEQEQLDNFLKNVDEVESIIRRLANNDDTAIPQADEVVQKFEKQSNETPKRDKSGFSKTVINQDAFNNWETSKNPVQPTNGSSNSTCESMDAAAFMAAMEEDCRERAERRRQYEKEAERLKLLGNEQFALGNYDKAAELYSVALNAVRDWTILWTNRAQAYIKLEKFEAALEDCTWAFKVDEACLKAAVLQGKAYIGLKEYNKARDSYARALKIAPQKEALINDYIAQVKLAEDGEIQEKAAQELFDAGQHTGLVSLMEKLKKPDQLPMYYSGGLQVIRQAIKDITDKTLFRTNGGLVLSQTHPTIRRCLSSDPDSISITESDMLASFFDVLLRACMDNELNQREVIGIEDLPLSVIRYLESSSKTGCIVAESALRLLLYLSQTAHGRSEIVTRYDVVRMISMTFAKVQAAAQTPSSSMALNAQRLITNLAMDPKFRRQVYDGFETEVLPSFQALLLNDVRNGSELSNIMLSINMMVNLCGDAWLRRKAAGSLSTWKACVTMASKYKSRVVDDQPSAEVICCLFGLLANMSYDGIPKNGGGDGVSEMVMELCSICCNLISVLDAGELLERCYLLLSRVLKCTDVQPAIVESVSERSLLEHTIELIQKGTIRGVTKYGIALLAICTRHSVDARQQVVDFPKGLKAVVGLLTDSDDVVVGNAALCLSHCVEVRRACKALTKTNILMDLLVLARDQAKPAVQHNCAILIARLAQGDQRHLNKLRELHGLEILNTVLKHVDS